ncbi:MAG: UDP-N-acetylmuramoyl-L-alanyl-D-glutamate--2,6-diaminopimelate ligase, partial [Armatimonadota bacterium]|nr:UDP-N-acetylmuramoyl-L-alanyl-D-glutamate--2,6-diaminopimelate ligase [Armatimonadota bacterium]
VAAICYDSRQVVPGALFVAIKGGTHDGHSFIPQALSVGASAIVAERKDSWADGVSVPYAVVEHGRRAMGEMSAHFYRYPSRSIKLIGVTGTSGKTTVTHLICAVFSAAGKKSGLIGTLGARVGDSLIDTKHTTPESVDIQRILREMVDQGVEVVAMEVSSHGLDQGRVVGCEFDCGVFTNIARDHLDFHKTPEAYLNAKLKLFREYPALSSKEFIGVVNADDASAPAFIEAAPGRVITFGVRERRDVTASNITVSDRRVEFDLAYDGASARIRMPIGGFFNVYNALAAAAVGIAFGLDVDTIAAGLAEVKGVPGRFEFVDYGQDFGVVVDYAHTPDELENVLKAAKGIVAGRLTVVFGCGGDRDRGKRPIMGRLAAELADRVVITSDNPRSEKPEDIIAEILSGVPSDKRAQVDVIVDRKEAIEKAIECAEAGDLVLIAGKGHETYQIFADRTIHFDDREVAREALRKAVERRDAV